MLLTPSPLATVMEDAALFLGFLPAIQFHLHKNYDAGTRNKFISLTH